MGREGGRREEMWGISRGIRGVREGGSEPEQSRVTS